VSLVLVNKPATAPLSFVVAVAVAAALILP
jgi:hypothetical protein